MADHWTGTQLLVDQGGGAAPVADEESCRTLFVPPDAYARMVEELGDGTVPEALRDTMVAPEPVAPKPRWAKTVVMQAVDPASFDPEPQALVARQLPWDPSASPSGPLSVRSSLDDISMELPALPQPPWVAPSEVELNRSLAALRRSEGIDHLLPPPHEPLEAPESQRTRVFVSPSQPPPPMVPYAPMAMPMHDPSMAWGAPRSLAPMPPTVRRPSRRNGLATFALLAMLAILIGIGSAAAVKMRGHHSQGDRSYTSTLAG